MIWLVVLLSAKRMIDRFVCALYANRYCIILYGRNADRYRLILCGRNNGLEECCVILFRIAVDKKRMNAYILLVPNCCYAVQYCPTVNAVLYSTIHSIDRR